MTNEEATEIIKAYKDRLTNSCSNLLDNDIEAFTLAIKALSEPKITVFTENQTIRWTDKVSLKDNGDIIDFEGRVVGHINFEEADGVQE